MKCPNCGSDHSAVYDSRPRPSSVCRRRECSACGHRWSTIELSIEEHNALRRLYDIVQEAREILEAVDDEKKDEDPDPVP